MKRQAVWTALAISLLLASSCGGSSSVEATVTDRVTVSGVVPFGVNLGNWTTWGAEQLSSNVIKNPGFEGQIDGAIVLPSRNGIDTFDDSPAWLGRPDGFWEGARYNIRAGQGVGATGQIVHSLRQGPGGNPTFTIHAGDTLPDPGTAVAITKIDETKPPVHWWFSKGDFAPAPGQTRPGSPGRQALLITSVDEGPAEASTYLDTLGDRAGKMLPLTGEWKFSFWAKVARGHGSLRVVLRREGSLPLLSREVPVSASWTNVKLSFTGRDEGPVGMISLRFQVGGGAGVQMLLDDVDLHRAQDENSPFRAEVVSALRSLHPGYLRDWQGQLGDTLENRLATPFARKPTRYRPDPQEPDYGYGLNEFIALAKEVGATPWIVIPTTFTDADCAGLGVWLSHQGLSSGRPPLLEFGNESWNDLFRPAGIPDPWLYGQAADRCLAAVKRGAGGMHLKTVIGTQFASPENATRFAQETREADTIAVAPYFGYSIPAHTSLEERLALLFAPIGRDLDKLQTALTSLKKELAVYEVNAHSTLGTATAPERLPVAASIATGTALARTMLESLTHGARMQCAYTLTGFDAGLPSGNGYIPLWGIFRDVGPTSRPRPTGLALQLMNQALGSGMFEVKQSGAEDVSVYAFTSPRGISALAVSGSSKPRNIVLNLPHLSGALTLSRLISPSPASTNEEWESVRIASGPISAVDGTVSFTLAPWSMAVLTPVDHGGHIK